MKTLFTLVAPGALALTATGMLLEFAPPELVSQAARGYPFVALIVAALLAWRLHRSRLLYAALLLLITHVALRTGEPADDITMPADDITMFAAVLLPFLLALLALTTDRSAATRYSLMQTLLVLVPAAAAIAAYAAAPQEVEALLTGEFFDPIYTNWTGLSQTALATGLCSLGLLTAIALYRGKALEAGLAWATLAGLLALSEPAGSVARGLWMLAAGIILIVALVEASYLMAFHDELTGLPARRALAQTLSALRPPYTVAIVDVDHFKSFNDRYGHDVGDEVLRMVASRLATVRGGGRAFRSGGEEFTLVFPGRTKAEAVEHVEDVREAVADARFTLRSKPRPPKKDGERRRGRGTGSERRIGVTISVGLAGVDGRNTTTDAVVKAADKAMYRAKQGGRNRVVA